MLAPRPNDYHPDHRYTGVLVQDAAYMVVVPDLIPEVPALRKNPVFLYYEDNFQRPNPFRPDIAVDLDSVIDKKIDALDSHVSQFYEWLPWVDGKLADVPSGSSGAQSVAEESAHASDQSRRRVRRWSNGTARKKATRRNITKLSKSANTACSRTRLASANYSRCSASSLCFFTQRRRGRKEVNLASFVPLRE